MKTSWQATTSRRRRLLLVLLFSWQFFNGIYTQSFTAEQLDRYELIIGCEDLTSTDNSSEPNDLYLEALAAFLRATVQGQSSGVLDFDQTFQELEEIECLSADELWCNYLLAEAHIMSSVLDAIHQRNISSVRHLRKAFRLSKKLRRDDTYERYAVKIQSSISLIISQLSDRQQWWLQLLAGLEGNEQQAIQNFHEISNEQIHFKQEIDYLLQFFELQRRDISLQERSAKTQIEMLLAAQQSMQLGQLDQALEQLLPCKLAKATHLRGRIYMYQGRWDQAILQFEQYMDAPDLYHWKPLSQLYVRWCEIANGSDQVRDLVPCEALLFEDKEACKEITFNPDPHRDILRARILFDGGNHDEALDLLNSIDFDGLEAKFKQELLYRRGRCYQKLGALEKAGLQYDILEIDHSSTKLYYRTAALLQRGIIFQSLGQEELAKSSFRKCLRTNPARYGTSLHRQAREQLAQLEK